MLSFNKRKTLVNSFVQSQFSFAPLVWMLCGKDANKKINRVHYKFLQVIYEDYTSTFEQLLNKYNAFTIHQRNIQNLLIEMHKVKYKHGPMLLNDIFKTSNFKLHALRSNKDFSRPKIKSTKYGEKSLANMGSIMWNLLPNNVKEIEDLAEFKLRVKSWKPEKCPCYLCKYYFLEGVGLIEIRD